MSLRRLIQRRWPALLVTLLLLALAIFSYSVFSLSFYFEREASAAQSLPAHAMAADSFQITAQNASHLNASGAIPLLMPPTVARSAAPLLTGSGIFTDSGQRLGAADSINLALGDLDSDGDLDAFVANTGGQSNTIWINQGGTQGGTAGTFADSGQSLGSSNSTDVALGLLNGDAHLDAFIVNGTNATQPNEVWFGSATGTFTNSGQSLGNSWSESVALGDLDGDTDLDAFVVNYNEDGNRVYLNQGGTQGGTAGVFSDSGQFLLSANSPGDSVAVALGDLNGDTFLDAVVGNFGPNTIWFNDGAGIFTATNQVLGNETTLGIALADLDGDTDLDIFAANNNSAGNRVYLNQGNLQGGTLGLFADSGQSLGTNNSEGVDLSDVDDDGDIDAIVGNVDNQPNRLWLNDGNGNFSDSGQAMGSSNSLGVRFGDLDGDTDPDLFVANRNQADTVWFNLDLTDSTSFSVIESNGETVVEEVGQSDIISVVLDAPPATTVVIDISSGDADEATVNPSSLTFTAGDWDQPQPVVVRGVEDFLLDGAQTVTLTLSVNLASDDAYLLAADQTVSVTVLDTSSGNQPPEITSSPATDATATSYYGLELTATDPDLADDPEEQLTWQLTTFPNWLFLDDHSDGTAFLTGSPPRDGLGSHNVVVTVRDRAGATDTQRFTINVSAPANTPPVAYTEQNTVDEDSAENLLDVLANDVDFEADPLTITSVGNAEHGVVTITEDGKAVLYTPDAGFLGKDFFEYTISDGQATATARSQLLVENVNNAPIAANDIFSIFEDNEQSLDVMVNDSDPDALDEPGILEVTPPQHGVVTIESGSRSLSYTPDPNYAGPDSFTYTLHDRLPLHPDRPGLTAQAVVSITVLNINDLPTVADDAMEVDEDSRANPITPLANDSDIDGDSLTVLAIGAPAQGTATLDGNTIFYTPTLGFTGRDSFTYTVSDDFGFSEGQIRVQVNNTPDAPLANDDDVRVTEDRVDVLIAVLVNDRDDDGDDLTVISVGNAGNGTTKLAADGSGVLYTPDPNYVGADAFTYTISDGTLQSEATVNITVVRGNKRPTAFVDHLTVDQDSRDNPLTVLANDRDSEGHRLAITQVDAPAVAGAAVQINPVNSALLYTPAPNFTGEDRFSYTISDGELTARAEVIVTVRSVANAADLALRRTDSATTLFADEAQGMTSHLIVTNHGPARADEVTLAADMGATLDGLLGIGANCSGNGNTITCALAPLHAGETTTITLHTLLTAPTGNDNLSASATVTSARPDPDQANNRATQELTVAAARPQQQFGELTIIADSFTTENGDTTARGNIQIGEHFTLQGDDATFTIDGAGNFSGNGALVLKLGNVAFFRGGFTADAAGAGTPAANVTNALTTIGGFAVNTATVGGFDLSSGEVTLQATLALAKGDLSAAPVVDLTVTPGPHIRGATATPFVANYGAGNVLRLHSLTGDLVRQGSDYRLRAGGVISYNLQTESFTETVTLSDTAAYRGALANVQVHFAPDGTISEWNESLLHLALPVDYLTLHLEPLTIDNQGLLATVATWQLPAVSGGGTRAIQNVRIGIDGLGLVNQVIDLPDMRPDNGAFVVHNMKSTLLLASTGFLLDNVVGDVTMDLPGNSYIVQNMQIDSPTVNAGSIGNRAGNRVDAGAVATVHALNNSLNPNLPIRVGGATVTLINGRLSGSTIYADGYTITLPNVLGGQTKTVNHYTSIYSQDLTLPGFPSDLSFGGVPLGSASAKIKNTSNGYVLTIKGKLLLSLPSKAGDTRRLTVDAEIILDSSDKVTGKVNDFTFNLAGFETGAKNVVIDDTKLKVGQASLSPPAILSRMGQATIYDLVITPPDDLAIGGGSFKFGPLAIGKFTLADMSGTLKKSNGEYIIGVAASLAIPGINNSRGKECAIGASLEIAYDPSTGRQILTIYPEDPNAEIRYIAAGDTDVVTLPLHPLAAPVNGTLPVDPATFVNPDAPISAAALTAPTSVNGVRFREASISLSGCEIPLGNSGGYLTKIAGKVTLDSGTTVIRVDVGLAYGKDIKPFGRVITADLYAELGLNVPYFYPTLTREFIYTRDKVHTGLINGKASLQNGYTVRPAVNMPLLSSTTIQNELAWRSSKGTSVPFQPQPIEISPRAEEQSIIRTAGGHITLPRVNPAPPLPRDEVVMLPTQAGTSGNVRRVVTYDPIPYTAILHLDWRTWNFVQGVFDFKIPQLRNFLPVASNPNDSGDITACNNINGTWQRLVAPSPSAGKYACVYDKGTLSISDVYELQRYRSDFTYKMGGTVKAFETFDVADGQLTLDAVRGLDASLNAENLTPGNIVELQKFHASLSAWHDYRGFNLTGKVGVDIVLPIRTLTMGIVPLSKGVKLGGLAADFGKFQYRCNGTTCYAWGLKGSIIFDIPGFIDWLPGVPDTVDITVFGGWSETENKFKFAFGGDAKQYQLVQRERVQRALQAQQQQLRAASGDNSTVFLPVDSDLTFLANDPGGAKQGAGDNGVMAAASTQAALAAAEDLLVDVPVAYNTNMTVMLSKQNGGPGMVLIAPDGTEYPLDQDALPGGIGYSQLRQFTAAGGPGLGASRGVARIRAIQTIDGPALNATITNNSDNSSTTLASGLGFGEAGAYIDLAAGNYTVNFSVGGQSAQTNLVLEAGQEMSLVAVGMGTMQIWPVLDDNRPLATEDAAIRMLHAAPTGPRLTVKQLFGREIFVNQRYLSLGDPVQLLAQEYDLGMHDVDQDEEMLTLELFTLLARHRYSLLVLQDAHGELVYRLITDATPVSSVRLLNGGANPLDLLVDGRPLVSAVPQQGLTADKTLPLGEHEIRLQRGGVVFAQQSVVITENQDLSLVYIDGGLQTYTETNQIAETDFVLARAINLTGRGDLDLHFGNEPVATAVSRNNVSLYVPLRYQPIGATVEVRQGGGVLASFADIMLAEGAAHTLYITDDNGTLRLIVGVDTAVNEDTVDYLRLDGSTVNPGNWHVRLTDAVNSTDDYELRVIGSRPDPVLSEPTLTQGQTNATVGWHYIGSEPDATIEIRLQEMTGPAQVQILSQKSDQIEVLNAQGFAKTQSVTETTQLEAFLGDIFGVDLLSKPDDVGWINGTPQQHTFNFNTIRSGSYQVQLIADDMVQPPVAQVAPTALTVNHPWPATWSANAVATTDAYQTITVRWDASPTPDVTDYIINFAQPSAGLTFTMTQEAPTQAITVTTLSPNEPYFISITAYDEEQGRYSRSQQVEITPNGAPFTLTALNPPATLEPGMPVTVDLRLATPLDPYPAAVTLAINEATADDVAIDFVTNHVNDVVTPTVGGTLVSMVITPSAVLISGPVTVTVDAYGGGTNQQITFIPLVEAPEFDLVLSTDNVTLAQQGAEMTVQANAIRGHDRPINLALLDLPDGVVATITPEVIRADEQATIRLRQTDRTLRGTYAIALVGDDGPTDERHTVTLQVQRPDFAVEPEEVAAANLGDGLDVRLTVNLFDGWGYPVTLYVVPGELPPDSITSLSTSTEGSGSGYRVTLENGGAAYLSIKPGERTPAGTYQITVYAESAGVQKVITFSTDAVPSARERIYLPVILHGPQQRTAFEGDRRLYLPLVAR